MKKRHTILIVDDETQILSAMRRALRNEPIRILTAESGSAALSIMDEQVVSLVISDYNMPGMNGLELLKKVRQDHPAALAIMLTGQSEIDIAMRAINEAGVYKFILKPWENNDLIMTIRRALESLDLLLERDVLLQKIKTRESVLQDLESEYPGISHIERDQDGYIV